MKNVLITSVLAASLCSIASAQAQDNLEDAMQGNIERLAEEGGEITFSSTDVGSDGSITYNDFVMLGEDDIRISSDWVKMTPAEGKPGSVVVTTAPVISMHISDGSPELDYDLEISHENLAFETNLLMMAVFAKPQFAISADMLRFNGLTEGHPVMKDLDIIQTQFSMTFALDEEAQTINGSWAADTITGSYGFEPEPGQLQGSTFDTGSYDVSFDVTGFDGDKAFEDWVNSGGTFQANMNSEGGSGETVMNTPEFSAEMSGTAGPSEASVSLLDGRFAYLAKAEAVDYDITPTSPGLPIPPFKVSMASTEMIMDMPVLPTEGQTTAKFVFDITELAVGEGLWMMIDPGETLPRDPANIEIRLDAQLKLNQSLVDAADAGPGANPFDTADIEKVTITALNVDIAGANVTAGGEVDFDNSGPFPMPNGAIDVEVNGVQGLSQKLVDLGLVDQMQTGMMMGMMMAFGVPGDQPDQFRSKIEFKPEGIFANGQPLR